MKMNKTAHRWIGLQNGIFYLLFAAVVGLLGFFGHQFKLQADWTYNNRNSLSQPTQALLQTLDKPLKFIAYIPDNPGLKNQLEGVVSKYQRVKADTSLEFVNPDLEPLRAKQDKIDSAGQLAIHLGERSEVVEETSEQVIANAIQRMSRGGERLVVFLEGHGERNPLATESSGMSKLAESLQRNGFTVQPHNLVRTQSLPQNASAVVIAAPQQDLLPGEVDILKKYVEQGGNLLWLQDPGGLHGLQGLEEQLGLQIHDGTIIDANEALQMLLGINHPAVVPVVDYGKSAIVQKLAGVQTLFPFATLVEPDPAAASKEGGPAWKTDAFLNSLPTSWLESSGVLEGAVTFDEGSNDLQGPLSIGISLTRTLEAATDKPDAPPRQQRVVVVGDSDFMLNSFVGHGANLELATNIFNWLSEDDNLLQVPLIRAPDTQMEMGETLGFVLGSLFLFGLPLGLLMAGLLIWWRRRKR
ncbi:MAG TPA: Gldg family protein [Candidatus Thiothrix moscowensis]|uniref:GldG family protein n=1 Tax=unclassified Thiothrix TaxID=2636184 RepID=UPI0025E1154D|nr:MULTISPECIES: DUF4350 domain-containing protein [unclassified Thiothrix]HRJ51142.1 Gldg family protein [Candidatus Thiothrix moscowensis]HRJ91803.1 Gldg family protein [Candidatus Thiothrix moscowensis]